MSVTTAAAPALSEAELQWQQSYAFDHHQVIGVYKRKTSFTVDTSEDPTFNAALGNAASTAFVEFSSRNVDNGRWKLNCRLHEKAGQLGCYLYRLKGSFVDDCLSLNVRFTIKLRAGTATLFQGTTKQKFKLAGLIGDSWGWSPSLSLETVRKHADFIKEKKIVIEVEIEEEIPSNTYTFLPQPDLSVKDLALRIHQLAASPADTCFVLDGGEFHAHESLMAVCEHFKVLLDGEFSEAKPKNCKTAETKLGLSSNASLSDSTITVELPNFSIATFQAFAFYLYTKSVTFGPLSSSTSLAKLPNKVAIKSVLPNVWPCSPKLMYEMADYLNVPDLVELCREAFLASIEPNNVLFELADSFSRLRKPIADALKDYAIKNWASVTASPDFKENLQTAMDYEESRELLFDILQRTKI